MKIKLIYALELVGRGVIFRVNYSPMWHTTAPSRLFVFESGPLLVRAGPSVTFTFTTES